MKRFLIKTIGFSLGVVVWSWLSGFGTCFAFEPAANVSQPENWRVSNPDFAGEANSVFYLNGGEQTTEWLSDPIELESRKLYRLRFQGAASPGTGGCAPCGTTFASYDFHGFPDDPEPQKNYSFVFVVPDNVKAASARLAQWEAHGENRFARPELNVVQPVFNAIKSADFEKTGEMLPLGAGESINNGEYKFQCFRTTEPANYDRPFVSTTARFNTDRWVLSNDTEVVYRLTLETLVTRPKQGQDGICREVTGNRKIPFASGSLTVYCGYFIGGCVVVEGSFDGEHWIKLDEIHDVATSNVELESFFNDFRHLHGENPDGFWVRIRGGKSEDGTDCSAQIYSITAGLKMAADADQEAFKGIGFTVFADVENKDAGKSDKLDALPMYLADGGKTLLSRISDSNDLLETRLNSEQEATEKYVVSASSEESDLNKNGTRYNFDFARNSSMILSFPSYLHQYCTREISGMTGECGEVQISWCEPDYRVPRDPVSVKIQPATVVEMNAAQNDYESFQIVLNPQKSNLTGISGEITGDLVNENGGKISAENVMLRYAFYHYVENPTDTACIPGYYPDALVPLEKGTDGFGKSIDVAKDQNLPVWVTVRIPKDTEPGKYQGKIRLTADNNQFNVDIPFTLNVWNFAIPEKNTIETAYGLSAQKVWRYHNCQTEEDKRAVFEKYLKIFGDYRISPYDPAPLDGIRVQWFPKENPPRCELDFSRFDKEMKRVFDKYHFTNFRLNFEGLGGGTFAERYDGEIAGYKSNTPEYQAMMTDYGRKLQEHLRETGLLDAAYVYWFDEPEPKDYDFVADGFAKLKKYAPEITRMLTEEPTEAFEKILREKDTSINVWCPVSPVFSLDSAKSEWEKGNRFWWYVCCYPKQPFCTEFIDHPSIEMRIWHWQTFERHIAGCLVWEATYWTSDTAFPDESQNPYLDPMSYVTSYGVPIGAKQFWGNGDGRFVYPPLSAATPGRNDSRVILDDPVASIRWEMIREGVQDYEMLTMLTRLTENRTLTPEQRDKVSRIFDFSPITKEMTVFSIDPQPLYEHRKMMAEMILELSR